MSEGTDTVIGTVRKNGFEEIRVTLAEYRGQQLVDIRIFAESGEARGGERRATKKGVCFSVSKLTAVIDALHEAQAEGIRRGLLEARP